jgi:two-component system, sensor histidine kinase and response regulator
MEKILLVEDEKQLLDNISVLLNAEGYEIITAENGLEALKKLDQSTPDLIISDIMMPYLSGFELFKQIKQNPKIKFIPFLFLTAKSSYSSIREGMNLGADDYITKPFTSEDLLKSVKVRLEKSNIANKYINEIRENISMYVPHELRTPLVTILGYSQLMLSEKNCFEKTDLIDMTERINLSAKRLNNRIEKFIQLSELEYFSENLVGGEDRKSFLNNNIVREIILSHYYVKDRNERIEISVEFVELELPDRTLHIILKELLENAVKFSKPDTQIIINGKKEKNYYYLLIEDFGIGIDKTQIFNIGAFRQFDRQDYNQEGNGLGLIFVKRVLEKIGGEIKIESVKNKFTKVTLKIPAT